MQVQTTTPVREDSHELPPIKAVLKRKVFSELDHLERKYGRVAVLEMLELWKSTL
ncbi:MAG: hypothetical protein AAGB16_06840 [Pseudomonadota bacterium]